MTEFKSSGQFLVVVMVVLAMSISVCYAGSIKDKPLLIQFGQTTPDARLLRKNVAYWEEYLPFDGLVLYVNAEKYAGRYGGTCDPGLPMDQWGIASTIFSHYKIDPDDYEYVIEELRQTRFEKFKHNFVLALVTPSYKFNWFDEKLWQTTIHNVKVLARIAKLGGCEGIFLDFEQYGSTYWWFKKLCEAFPDNPQDWKSYANIVRRRGSQLIEAINSEFPGCQILTCFASSYVNFGQTDGEVVDKPHDRHYSFESYGLVAPFTDGLILGADANTIITDGYEGSYYYKSARRFARAREVVRSDCKRYSSIPELYSSEIQVAFGIWPAPTDRFDPNDLSNSYFSPRELEYVVRAAMNMTDKYVWIWNGSATFWIKGGPGGQPLLADQPHVTAIGEEPQLDLTALSSEPTLENVMHKRYYGMPDEIIQAIAQGKMQALEDVETPPR